MNIHTGEIRKPPPKHAAAKKGFNEFVIGERKISFEDRLEALETAAAPVLQQIARSRSTGWLSSDQKSRLARFMATQSFRTEAFHVGMNAKLAREEFGPIFSELWRGSFIAACELMQRHWIVMVIEHDDVFYLGDNPLVLQNTEHPSDACTLGFDIKGTEAFLPLSPKCALYMPCRTTSDEIKSGYEKALRAHRTMRSAAMRAVEFSQDQSDYLHLVQRVIGNSFSLFQAITQGDFVVAKPENVENFNYLQCAWSHTEVFSNRKDFTFANRVLRENPQYRGVLQTHLDFKWPREFANGIAIRSRAVRWVSSKHKVGTAKPAKDRQDFADRHGRACPGHPRLHVSLDQDVDARAKRGHDGMSAQSGATLACRLFRRANYRFFFFVFFFPKIAFQFSL
jgi:hypothetical protein